VSHITKIKTVIHEDDLDAMAQGAVRLGGQLVRDVDRYKWYGRWMRDSPLPEGVPEEDLGKCAHVIRFPRASYEVGLVRQADGTYTVQYDDWRQGGLAPIVGEGAAKLLQAFGVETSIAHAHKLGHRLLKEEKLPNGRIKLQFAGRF